MEKGYIRLFKGRDLLPQSDPLHEHEKESVKVEGDFLPQNGCDLSPWCAIVTPVDDEGESRLRHAVITNEAAIVYLHPNGEPARFGEVGRFETIEEILAPISPDKVPRHVFRYRCHGAGSFMVDDDITPEVDVYLDEVADRRYGKKD